MIPSTGSLRVARQASGKDPPTCDWAESPFPGKKAPCWKGTAELAKREGQRSERIFLGRKTRMVESQFLQ